MREKSLPDIASLIQVLASCHAGRFPGPTLAPLHLNEQMFAALIRGSLGDRYCCKSPKSPGVRAVGYGAQRARA
jgi:hypothetical protein